MTNSLLTQMNENWLSQSGLASGENGIPEVDAMPARALMSCSLTVWKEVACLVSRNLFYIKIGNKKCILIIRIQWRFN